MKKFVSVLALAFISQTAHAALNPVLLQQIAQQMVNTVIQNDDLVQSLKGEFNTSQTNLEQNIAAVETVGKTRNVPWAVGVESTEYTNGSYRAVKRASRYGVEATAVATVTTPVLAAMRYTAKEANKNISPNEPYSAEAKAVLVQLETVQSMSEAFRLLKELNQVGKHALDDNIASSRARVVDEDENGGEIFDPSTQHPRTNCQFDAMNAGSGTYFNYSAYRTCVDRKKAQLDALEMTKIVQDTMTLVLDNGTITITVQDAGGILEAAPDVDRQSIMKFENRVSKVIITPVTITATAQAFVGLRKHEFERIEKEFKTALNKYQAQDPQTISDVDSDLRRILRDVKAFIRNRRSR